MKRILMAGAALLALKVSPGVSDAQELKYAPGEDARFNWEILTASAFVTIIVTLTVFFALQRYLVRRLLAGAVKGGWQVCKLAPGPMRPASGGFP